MWTTKVGRATPAAPVCPGVGNADTEPETRSLFLGMRAHSAKLTPPSSLEEGRGDTARGAHSASTASWGALPGALAERCGPGAWLSPSGLITGLSGHDCQPPYGLLAAPSGGGGPCTRLSGRGAAFTTWSSPCPALRAFQGEQTGTCWLPSGLFAGRGPE